LLCDFYPLLCDFSHKTKLLIRIALFALFLL
jgi:hypothetical protein